METRDPLNLNAPVQAMSSNTEMSAIVLGRMPTQTRIFNHDDDWTGITDPVERKKIQNRLNKRTQRAKIKSKRDIAKIALNKRLDAGKPVFILPRSEQSLSLSKHPKSLDEAIKQMLKFNASAYERYLAGNPCLDQLLTLTKFNILRAIMDNVQILGMSTEYMSDNNALSCFNLSLPDTSKGNIPHSLSPTAMQRSVPHHPWLDCFPFPQMRDNLIAVAETFNDCDLCTDVVDPTNGDVGMLVWGDPWLPENWEVSELFVAKWSWVILGCPELLVSSNYWRSKRGLKPLNASNILRSSLTTTNKS